MVTLNSNWPIIETAWGPAWDAGGGRIPPDRYVELTAIGTFATGRGRQYQLDQVQAGTSSMTLPNTDGSLDPDNAAGPYAGRILPFQPIRRRAQWPPTVNLLTQVQATAGDVGGQALGPIDLSDTGPRILSDVDSAPQFVASGTAWQGGTVAQFQVTAAAAAGQRIVYTEQPAVKPGQTYTVQIRVRNITPSTTMQVAAAFRTATATGAAATSVVGVSASLVGSATAAWTQLTVTATAAATSAWMSAGLQVVSAPGATCQIQCDGWQVEKGATASTWVQPGVWYPVSAHFAEKWTADWADSGTRGIVQPSGVDALALLSQDKLPDPLSAEIAKHSPRFLYTLGDPEGSQQVTDSTGNYPPAAIAVSKAGPGSLTLGVSITATDPAGVFAGSGTVCTIANSNPGTNLVGPATFIDLRSAGINGPANVNTADWTRMIAFRYTGPTPTAGNSATIWATYDKARGYGARIAIYVGADGKVTLSISGPTGADAGLQPAGGGPLVTDGDWHLVIVTFQAPTVMTISVDGQLGSYTIGAFIPSNLYTDSIGSLIDPSLGNQAAFNFQGDVAFATEFAVAMYGSDIPNLYSAWRNAFAGESTGTRYSRILAYAGYAGASVADSGLTTSMGPASGIAGQDPVSALQAVVDTEGGAHYVTAGGVVTFASRSRRYNALTPVYVFGERADLGEWPYEECKPDFDATHLGNIVEVTQEATGQVFTAVDDASTTSYFPRSITRTVNASDPYECQDAANYLKSRFAQPSTRVASLKLHPSAVPALWPVCLSLEQGMRIRVMRRPLGAPAIQIEAFVEKLDWSMTDGGDAVLTVQASRADTTTYGLFAAWHTTMQACAAGATTLTINAPQDNVNPLAAQLSPGTVLTITPSDSALKENVTVRSVASNGSPWTTGTITLTASTVHAHTSGATICEALPAGVTDPTTWDGVSQFDNHAFAY